MVRIIPWNLPPVKGGSVGGYTPAPTPVVTNYPYDFTNLTAQLNIDQTTYVKNGWITTSLKTYGLDLSKACSVSISGVDILDTSSVASVVANVTLEIPDDITWDTSLVTMSWTATTISQDLDITALMTSQGGSVSLNDVSGLAISVTAASSSAVAFYVTNATLNSIKVYNSNGVVLQEWTP